MNQMRLKRIIKILCNAIFFQLAAPSPESRAGYNPLEHMWEGTRDIPNNENYEVFAAGAALTAAGLLFWDDGIQAWFKKTDRMGGTDNWGNKFFGTWKYGIALGVGTLGFGLISSQDYAISSGEAHLEALTASGVYTEILKRTVRRSRPDAQNSHDGFPSGHVSTVFTTAAVMMDRYGPWVGAPALGIGVLTGMSRLQANRHHFSDVAFAAGLGYVVGHGYTRHHVEPLPSRASVKVLPFWDEDKKGVNVAMEW